MDFIIKEFWIFQRNPEEFARLAEWGQSVLDELTGWEPEYIGLESFLQDRVVVYIRKIKEYLSLHDGLPSDINWQALQHLEMGDLAALYAVLVRILPEFEDSEISKCYKVLAKPFPANTSAC